MNWPARLLLIRHAEKPVDTGAGIGPELTPAGERRAALLAEWLPQQFGAIDALFVTAPSAHSRRPLLTLEPLGLRLGLPLQQSFGKGQTLELAEQVLDGRLAGRTVLICWVHEELPLLTRQLGAEPPLDPWPDSVYDPVWLLEMREGSVTLTARPQMPV